MELLTETEKKHQRWYWGQGGTIRKGRSRCHLSQGSSFQNSSGGGAEFPETWVRRGAVLVWFCLVTLQQLGLKGRLWAEEEVAFSAVSGA